MCLSSQICEFKAKNGRILLKMRAIRLGEDLQVLLTGGESHIGAVAVARPDALLHIEELPGHREGPLAGEIAQRLAKETGALVALTCGIHFDCITSKEINLILNMAKELAETAIKELKRESVYADNERFGRV